MKWISITDKEPQKKREWDAYTNCVCGIENKGFIADAVYYHHDKKFFHNQDTSNSNPIPATHWFILKPPTS